MRFGRARWSDVRQIAASFRIETFRTKPRLPVHLLPALFALSLAASLQTEMVLAQSANGLISGTVVDEQHASIAGAAVRVTDQLNPQWSTVNNTALFDESTGQQVNSALARITGDRGARLMQLGLRVEF